MTVDEGLNLLEDGLRRLKIEFDVYFAGGKSMPPFDLQGRVQNLIKKLDGTKLTYAQRFRYNSLAERFAVFSDLWRQKVKAREEGPRLTGARRQDEQLKKSAFRIDWRDPALEPEKVDKLFAALIEAKKQCGENVGNVAADTFRKFIDQKTAQLKRDFQCEQVEYVIEVEDGQVKLKAKALKGRS